MPKKSFSVLFNDKIKVFNKIVDVDPDKSISIRSFLISAISNNISKISNALNSDDVKSCIRCLQILGVKIKKKNGSDYLVFGKGLGSLYSKKNQVLDCGNSGTLARLLIGILSTTPNISVKITGDKSLKKRNMSRLLKPMNEFGARFFPSNKNFLPLKLISSEMPVGISYNPGNSAQIKSAIILAGINSFGTTNIIEKQKTRDHTENILISNSNSLKIEKENNILKVFGKNNLNSIDIKVPSDPSSAAFFAAICILNKGSKLKIKKVCLNNRRIGFYKLLKAHGAKIKMQNIKKENNELVGDIVINGSKLKPIISGSDYYLSATDEYPILFVMAALTKGTSKFKGISELSNKESNRILEMKNILKKVGVRSVSSKNSLTIFGKNTFKKKNSLIKIDSKNDHRIAMSTAILAMSTGTRLLIKNFETVNTSSPSFLKIIKLLGGKFEIKKKL
tara:strand:- start:3325 stop:4674 length:1350 start_codon:yes stop_codon:yes gene_type:complete